MPYDWNKSLQQNLNDMLWEQDSAPIPQKVSDGTYLPKQDNSLKVKALDIAAKEAAAKKSEKKSTDTPTENSSVLTDAIKYSLTPRDTIADGALSTAVTLDNVDDSIFNYNNNNFVADAAKNETENANKAAYVYSPITGMGGSSISGLANALRQQKQQKDDIAARENADFMVNNYHLGDDGKTLFTKTHTGEIKPVYDPYNTQKKKYQEAVDYLKAHPDAPAIPSVADTTNIPVDIDDPAYTSALVQSRPKLYENNLQPNELGWKATQETVESRLTDAFNNIDPTTTEQARIAAKNAPSTEEQAKISELEKAALGDNSPKEKDPLDRNQRWGTIQTMRDHISRNEVFSENTLKKFGNDIKASKNDLINALDRQLADFGSIENAVYALEAGDASTDSIIAKYYPKLDPLDERALGIAHYINEAKRNHPKLSRAVIGTVLTQYLTNDTLSSLGDTLAGSESGKKLKALNSKFENTLKKLDSTDKGNIFDIEDSIYGARQKLLDLNSVQKEFDTATTSINNANNLQILHNSGQIPDTKFSQAALLDANNQAMVASQALFVKASALFEDMDEYSGTTKNRNHPVKND